MSVEVDVLGSPSLRPLWSRGHKAGEKKKRKKKKKASGHQCVKVDMAVLGSLSLISLVVSVDVKQH